MIEPDLANGLAQRRADGAAGGDLWEAHQRPIQRDADGAIELILDDIEMTTAVCRARLDRIAGPPDGVGSARIGRRTTRPG